MVVIYSASSDRGSVRHSSRMIEPIVRWLFPKIQDQTVRVVVYYVRKAAHVTEYAVLAMLLWHALSRTVARQPRVWSWKIAALVLLAASLYAASDEIHQLFVPDREGRPIDVLIDTGGASVGLLIVWVVGRWRNHRLKPA
jgi:VanZ family protein